MMANRSELGWQKSVRSMGNGNCVEVRLLPSVEASGHLVGLQDRSASASSAIRRP